MVENTPSYSIAVPQFVLADRGISPTAKLLYGVIDSFLKRTGVCYATNSRLAEEVAGCSERTISRCVSELKNSGYIKVGLLPQAADKTQARRITLNVSTSDGQGVDKNGDTPHDKIVYPPRQKCLPPTIKLSTPHDKNGDIVLLNINNTNKEKEINKEKEKIVPRKGEEPEEVFDPLPLFVNWIGAMDASRDEKNALYLAILRFLENRAVLKKPYKSKGGVTALCNRLRRLSEDSIQGMIELLDRATDNGWQSVYPEGGDEKPAPTQPPRGRVFEEL